MNHNLLLLQDQESECSFDSSEFCSIGERTASIDSNGPNNKLQTILMTPTMRTHSIDQIMSEKTVSIQKPRIQLLSQKNTFQQQDMLQVGFVMGKHKKNIAFNQSKLKKVKNFFDQDELTFNSNDDSFQTHSLFQFPKRKEDKLLSQETIAPRELSNPCFQNFGKKKNAIQIDQTLLQKAKNFFNDDIEDTNTLLSFKKPTKVKKPFKQVETEENFVKTVNVNKNKKKLEVKKMPKKQIFDWDRFQVSSKKLIVNGEKSFGRPSLKKSSNIKSKQPKVVFQTLKLQELNWQQLRQQKKMLIFLEKKQSLYSQTFHHEKSECRIIKCLLCDIGIQEVDTDQFKLEQIFTNKLILEKINPQIFAKLYEQICFKLLKYDTFYPEIINKRLNPSNILVEMHKKSKLIESGNACLGWLDFCLKQSKFYHSFLSQVKQIHHNQKIKTYFIKLSDGWTNVWAVVTEKNYLYNFAHKIKICSKLFIGYWKNYALGNVLSFCPLSQASQKCIEIWYNSTIIVKQNMKLGKPGNTIFYRPLDKNRKQGGLIPTVEGIILRMFCSFSQQSKKNSTSYFSSTDQSFNDNYVQILTPQGYSLLIKFILPSQRSLAELFRLYYRYHFYFLKIGTKDNILQFNDGISKFFEFEKKDKKHYDKQLIDVLRKRYVNVMTGKLQNSLKVGGLYDIFFQNNQCMVNGLKFVIDNNNQNDTTTSSFLKGGSFLYQQYQLDKLQNMKSSNNHSKENSLIFILKRTKFSNTLKTLPAIYKEINLMQ